MTKQFKIHTSHARRIFTFSPKFDWRFPWFFRKGLCDGYGDPHYQDFNGNHFGHEGNCTYILSQDSINEPPIYTVLLHHVECNKLPDTNCPKNVEVIYGGYNVILLSDQEMDGVSGVDDWFVHW